MPTTKSAAKRMHTSRIRQGTNRSTKSELTTQLRQLREIVTGGDKSKAAEASKAYASLLDKSVKRGVIKANNASRHKSRAAAMLAKMG